MNRFAPGPVELAAVLVAADQKNDSALHIGALVKVVELILELEVQEL
jgi:hypothetical protein